MQAPEDRRQQRLELARQWRQSVYGAFSRFASRRALVLVQEAAETVATLHRDWRRPRPRRLTRRSIRRQQVQTAMRPPTVVMLDEHRERALQMCGVQHQKPIEAFCAGGPDEPFGDTVRLRRLNRRLDDSNALSLEHGIETVRELAVPISDEKANRFRPIGKGPGHLPRLLRDPVGVGTNGASGKMDATAGDLDEEQHVYPLKPDRVDGEEIHGDDTFGLCAQELTPRWSFGPARGKSSPSRRIFLTVVADTTMPRPFSSPTMRW